MARNRRSAAWKYWGYLPFAGALLGWLNPAIGTGVILALAALSMFYFFFQVPRPCGAWNRGERGRCRNNAYGLLRGCHLQEHKWQNMRMLVNYHRWRELGAGLWASWKSALPALAQFATMVSGVSAALMFFIAQPK
ncbi:hypothetical protein EKD16_21235 [Streptomonospora litoralis]|uniref:Uncharacterized protein n=2 Tax=Streptomonospora litoralis TaxID=2498135 RepID=A0A4P6Q5S2_9ACTN|nr:hypothetical protein EKD16_21235 [Streptomonospora litoralis]